MLVVIDPGNYSTKYFYKQNGTIEMRSFLSITHDYIPIATAGEAFKQEKHNALHRIEYMGYDKYIGDAVSSFYQARQDDNLFTGGPVKGHFLGLLRIVFSLYQIFQATGESKFTLCITSPVKSKEKDKLFFEEKLKNNPVARIDGASFSFTIEALYVGAEGLGAKRFVDQPNCIIVDAGSQTTNILKFINDGFTDESKTINFGTHNTKLEAIAEGVFRALNGVDYEYPVRVTGGKAQEIAKQLESFGYHNVLPVQCQVEPYLINGYGLYFLLEAALESDGDPHGA